MISRNHASITSGLVAFLVAATFAAGFSRLASEKHHGVARAASADCSSAFEETTLYLQAELLGSPELQSILATDPQASIPARSQAGAIARLLALPRSSWDRWRDELRLHRMANELFAQSQGGDRERMLQASLDEANQILSSLRSRLLLELRDETWGVWKDDRALELLARSDDPAGVAPIATLSIERLEPSRTPSWLPAMQDLVARAWLEELTATPRAQEMLPALRARELGATASARLRDALEVPRLRARLLESWPELPRVLYPDFFEPNRLKDLATLPELLGQALEREFARDLIERQLLSLWGTQLSLSVSQRQMIRDALTPQNAERVNLLIDRLEASRLWLALRLARHFGLAPELASDGSLLELSTLARRLPDPSSVRPGLWGALGAELAALLKEAIHLSEDQTLNDRVIQSLIFGNSSLLSLQAKLEILQGTPVRAPAVQEEVIRLLSVEAYRDSAIGVLAASSEQLQTPRVLLQLRKAISERRKDRLWCTRLQRESPGLWSRFILLEQTSQVSPLPRVDSNRVILDTISTDENPSR